MNENKQFYVYAHIRPDNGSVFYAGKGKNRRALISYGRSVYWKNTVKKCGGFDVCYVAKGLDEELAFLVEMEYIDVLRRRGFNLVNLTEGGEGISGFVFSEESRAKIGIANKKQAGKKLPEEVKKKIGLSRTGKYSGENHPRYGKKHSAETIEKMKLSSSKKRPVLCVDTGVIYYSASEAARALGLKRRPISRVCCGERKTTGGYRFAFAER